MAGLRAGGIGRSRKQLHRPRCRVRRAPVWWWPTRRRRPTSAGAGAGGTGYVMKENAKNLRTKDEIYEEKRNEIARFLEDARQRANQLYRLGYFDIDRNKPDFITFNAYEMVLSDGITKTNTFHFIEKQKLYQTRTRREVDRVTKKKTYYK